MFKFDEDRLFAQMGLWVDGLASTGDFKDDVQGLTQAVWDSLLEEYRARFPEDVEEIEHHDITIREMIYEAARDALNR